MKILFLGDVVGKAGRRIVNEKLSLLKKEYNIDFTIINGENSAHGKGITHKIYNNFKNVGVDVITLGNHAFSKREIIEHLDDCPDLIRPLNIEPKDVGKGIIIKEVLDKKIAVVNLCGNVFIDNCTESPFDVFEKVLPEIEADIIIVDLHAEATSEKVTFFEYYKDKITAVLGTHTHVQTSDERIKDGCAFITDVGMCGAYDSVLGRDIEEVFDLNIKKIPSRFKPAEGPAILCGVIIDIDDNTNRAINIKRIQIRPDA
ncbi:MAG: TIGR00282 family metallophosphoesterase [Erysipelotrichaceae bacterium]|nr:TIGR00282 family metallophosphoesterase [Erysipelotrichaceae bacterium]